MTERFYRSRRDRVLGGVAKGLAEYWNLDPVIVRVLFIIVAMMTGVGVFLYIILWIIIPEEPYSMPNFGTESSGAKQKDEKTGTENTEDAKSSSSNFEYKYNYENNYSNKRTGNGRVIGGIVLIVIGLFFLAERIFPYFDFHDFLPLILIGIGLVLILNSNRNKKNAI